MKRTLNDAYNITRSIVGDLDELRIQLLKEGRSASHTDDAVDLY